MVFGEVEVPSSSLGSTQESSYNWGYDPQNYNAPETSMSTNPNDPGQVIRDLKTMIQAYHDAGIGVIMDVVYNHTFSIVDAPFQTTVPDYYYRMTRIF